MAKPSPSQPVENDDATVPTKGHATPSRKEQEAARKRPLVPSDRRLAAKQSRSQVQAARDRARAGMANGEEKYLPVRDKGPQKRYIRDYIDARFSIGEVLLPLLVVVIIGTFIDSIAVYVFIGVYSIFAVVVGAMAAGWGTPTESAAVGALATIVLALVYRALSVKVLLASLKGTVAISAMILFIIVGATTFAQILSFSGASNGLAEAITGSGLAPWAVIAAMMLMLIFLGIFVDQVSMMMITLPIFMPVVQTLGVDLVWFGVLFLICMQMGLLLPPHGLLLMTMKGVAPPQVTMLHIFRAVVPFLAMSVLLLLLVFFVPAVATWLPALIG